ncbi:B3 domain-containing transcription repressor VAL1-like [Micractinium conductrix]|uniref:B3 domain-containing transcription repressor VAL1-like n=1 Tax=Micractinium conductrix TaxID=554055 RepID=A0A2P6VD10_9CHLO|nr:B3 domain-containing transcription repressor VAL1-like [Micractinium conductrix]|eukprot:PSC71967.1 B3 domain-containing transcription repressor VAL1-like [Micractinium conductrix]
MGGTLLFEKVLTSSDVNGTGRLVIPKSQAEAHFPPLEEPAGTALQLEDSQGRHHSFRFHFWANAQSRMYLLEGSKPVLAQYGMQAGDVLVFARLPEGRYAIAGRQGTKDDVSRKPPTRRAPSGGGAASDGSPAGGGGEPNAAPSKRRRSRGGESLKAKRLKAKQAAQEVQSMMGYWSGQSLPVRRDGVFRAAPPSAGAEAGDRVVAQYGAWSAIVWLGGELFQAFFDTLEAADAALEAALQAQQRPAVAAARAPRSRSGSRPTKQQLLQRQLLQQQQQQKMEGQQEGQQAEQQQQQEQGGKQQEQQQPKQEPQEVPSAEKRKQQDAGAATAAEPAGPN